VSSGDGDLKCINDTTTFSYSEKNNMTDKPCLGYNYNNNYDELAYLMMKFCTCYIIDELHLGE
jgi:hypothetical protein